MGHPKPPTGPVNTPPGRDKQGPYPADNGADAYSHTVNDFGRCKNHNDETTVHPPGCPNRGERTAELNQMTIDQVVSVAVSLNIPIPPVPVKGPLIQAILDAEGY